MEIKPTLEMMNELIIQADSGSPSLETLGYSLKAIALGIRFLVEDSQNLKTTEAKDEKD